MRSSEDAAVALRCDDPDPSSEQGAQDNAAEDVLVAGDAALEEGEPREEERTVIARHEPRRRGGWFRRARPTPAAAEVLQQGEVPDGATRPVDDIAEDVLEEAPGYPEPSPAVAAAEGVDAQDEIAADDAVPENEADPDEELEPEVAAVSTFARHGRRRRSPRPRRARAAEPAVAPRSPAASQRFVSSVVRALRIVGTVVVIAALLMGVLFGLVVGINVFARWNAHRLAASAVTAVASENLLVIGVRDGTAIGFTALKVERNNKRVLGIAIPDGAFVEVPGQGFERIGESYAAGPVVSEAAVSNYFAVPFGNYVVVDGDTYQALLQNQNIGAITGRIQATSLAGPARATMTTFLRSVDIKDVWIVPLPVKAMTVGAQRYFEPQRAQVADLLLQWWGVRIDQQKARPRVIVYNGVGTPGLASEAAQQLIRKGFRVVDSGNAEHFGYVETTILVYHSPTDAPAVRDALGVGAIQMQSAPQELTDMIVIIGADYLPPDGDTSTVATEGAR